VTPFGAAAPGGRATPRKDAIMSVRNRIGVLFACWAFAATPAEAQTVDKRTLTLDGARRVADAASAEATRLNAPGGAIAVVDDGGHVVLVVRLDNTFPAATSVATGKARTAAQFRRPTSAFEDAIKNGRVSLTAVTEMVPLQGGVPIVVGGQVVGAVGVSGAASAQQDDDIAKVAALALDGEQTSRR
jgi:glc operon protein GlcG